MKNTVFTLITLSIGILSALIIGEGVIRYYYFELDGFSYSRLNSFKPLGVSGLLKPSQDKQVLYELKPNLDTIFKLANFKTNSLGFRSPEIPINKPDNCIRIAIIGDSFAMGSGVNNEETYSVVLEQLLQKKYPDIQFQVINFSVGGYNLLNYIGVLNTKAFKFDPDMVIVGFCGGNDFRLPHKKHYMGSYSVKPSREVFWISYLKKEIVQFCKKEIPKNYLPASLEQLNFVKQSLKQIDNKCSQEQVPLLMVYYSFLAKQSDMQKIEAIADTLEINFLNVWSDDIRYKEEKYIFHKLDGHPSALTHNIIANRIFEKIITSKQLRVLKN